jgi:hypothetical protein
MRWPAYRGSKESGIEWVGSTPDHWVEELAIARPIRYTARPTPVDGHARGAPIQA